MIASSDLQEMTYLPDRVVTFYRGLQIGEIESNALTSASIPIRSRISRRTRAAFSRFALNTLVSADISCSLSTRPRLQNQKVKLAIGIGNAGGDRSACADWAACAGC